MENHNTANSTNPLSKYFRQPTIHIKLPTNGRFWPEGTLDLPVTGEIPVYPMTTRDEITLRTPDALMNGSGVVEVIHSCCPNIKDVWQMPSVDVDAVLIAIRIASYGHDMDIDSKCPHCGEENTHALDLRVCLASITCPDYDTKISYEDLKIKVRPQPYFGTNKEDTINFEEQKLLQAIEKSDIDDATRAKEIAKSMNRLIEISVETVTASTEYIELSDGTIVREPEYIRDFYNNADGVVIKKVQARLAEIQVEGGIKLQKVKCNSCSADYQIPVVFNYASFFANGF